MADETKPPTTPEEVAKHNAEVAATLAAQDAAGNPAVHDTVETSGALDALVEQVTKEKEAPPEVEVVAPVPPVEAPATPAAPEVKLFDDIALPPKASPKSTEAFATIKLRAAQELTKRDEQIAALQKEVEETKGKAATVKPMPAETEAELQELREFRAKVDLESDPKFAAYDKKAEVAAEVIYAKLKAGKVLTDEHIKAIRSYGGPVNVNMEKILETVTDPALRRLVEHKLTEIEAVGSEKEQALVAAKTDVKQYIAERQKAGQAAGAAHNTETKAEFSQLVANNMPWMAQKTAPAGAKDEDRKAVETHNKFVDEIQKEIAGVMEDDSPRMRAVLIAGTAQLIYLQQVHRATSEKMVDLEKKLAEANEFVKKYKDSASSTRLRESSAPPAGGRVPEKKSEFDFVPTTQALDDIAKQLAEERRSKQ